jgi:hypothetical protein
LVYTTPLMGAVALPQIVMAQEILSVTPTRKVVQLGGARIILALAAMQTHSIITWTTPMMFACGSLRQNNRIECAVLLRIGAQIYGIPLKVKKWFDSGRLQTPTLSAQGKLGLPPLARFGILW